ncbi:MAG: HU family DNA-binding protein [candidate division KSB1 bacterium]|nr:HU family DNA-binding protein [candidate division KSB1 bacterium]MDZ7368442.1 HU family DNA-binding protein [candidate division KSB1 bacterium]MDZ7406168.1 HU family DNA-binding protein [candidate division KSB1 bacterium]
MAANKGMTKGQLVAHFAEKFDLTRAQVAEFFAELAKVAAKEARHTFTIPDIGKLVLVKRKARMGRNPKTGEPIQIPAKTVVKFRIAKACKDAILGGKK